jgi:hypothetical protein
MWTVVKVQDTEVLRDVMDRWKSGIDGGQPQRVANVFAEDAVFQGLRPYSVGRQGVIDYYASQPRGMTVTYRILETRSHCVLRVPRQTHRQCEHRRGHHARRRRLAHPAVPGLIRDLAQGGDDLALEQLDAGPVVGGLGEVQDRVLAAEFAHPLQLLDNLFRCAASGVG